MPGNNRLTARYPVAREADGKSITQTITVEFIFSKPAYSVNVGYDGGDTRPYPAVLERAGEAQLYRRSSASAPREVIAKSEWSFGKCTDGKTAAASDLDVQGLAASGL